MISHSHLTIPNWKAPSNVVAFTTQIGGGFSDNEYCSLNLGLHVNDNRQTVLKNRLQLPYSNSIHWLEQTHSDISISLPSTRVDADASFTEHADIACAVMTADCLPILVTDKTGARVSAIHAGWQGLATRIIAKTIERAFAGYSSEDLLVWIGPSIQQCHYEVDEALTERFKHYSDIFKPSTNKSKYMLDLVAVAKQQVHQLGINNVFSSGECTYCEKNKYFSFRRSSHQGFSNCGRMVSIIMKQNSLANA